MSSAIPAALVLAILALLVLGPMAGMLQLSTLPGYEPAELRFWEDPYLRRVLFFSVWQALLSTLLSVLPAILVARAFAMQEPHLLQAIIVEMEPVHRQHRRCWSQTGSQIFGDRRLARSGRACKADQQAVVVARARFDFLYKRFL